jgi:hypothetical protein
MLRKCCQEVAVRAGSGGPAQPNSGSDDFPRHHFQHKSDWRNPCRHWQTHASHHLQDEPNSPSVRIAINAMIQGLDKVELSLLAFAEAMDVSSI